MSNIERKPKIRFPEFTDAWEQCKLGDVTDSYSGGTPTVGKNDYYGGNIPFIRSAEINSKSTELFITEKGLKNSSAKMVSKGTILYALYGATSGECGISQINGAINQAILAIIPKNNFDSYFITTWLRRSKFEIISTYLQGGQGNLSGAIVKDLILKVPSINEQKTIGTYFEQLDNLITLHQSKLEILKKLKKGFLQKLFPQKDNKVPELRFPGFSGDWEQCKLGDLGTTYSGLSGKKKEDFGHGEARFITFLNVMNNAISDPSMTGSVEIDNKQNKVKKGDVLFTVSSETPNDVGTSSVIVNDCENTYLNSFCFGYRPKTEFDLFYLAYMLRAPSFRNDVILLAQGISRYNISKNKVMEIKITIPSSEEQHKVGCAMKSIDNLITLHQRKLEILQNIKKGFLQQMFV